MTQHLLNKKTMARSCNIGVTAFDKWGVEPAERRGREALYDVASVIRNRVDNELRKLVEGAEDIDDQELLRERVRLTRAQADAQELKNEKERDEVIAVDFMRFILTRVTGEIASILDTIPLSVQRKNPGLDSRAIKGIQQDITKARNRAAGLSVMIPALVEEYERLNSR
ncbi:terminase small subunit [Buttiauxella selenatireducens]|uniref:Terminase small subunit n=1 Tax=Buttiauxella selenatireducens TaxID=3073902 RepID=A0ABY9S5H1_9ENTR|nr:terminase small subunit [Buttiauxella sp. R73]WMY72730.1 terminase small subunit [Buttiauxella sp. R73]